MAKGSHSIVDYYSQIINRWNRVLVRGTGQRNSWLWTRVVTGGMSAYQTFATQPCGDGYVIEISSGQPQRFTLHFQTYFFIASVFLGVILYGTCVGSAHSRPRHALKTRSPQAPQMRSLQINGLLADFSSGWIASLPDLRKQASFTVPRYEHRLLCCSETTPFKTVLRTI